MGYFSKVPSYSDVKGFLSDSLTSVKDGFDTYYPVVRDAAKDYYKTGKDYAGRGAVWIKDKAIEYPGSTVALANLAMVLVAGRVTSAVDKLLGFVFKGKGQEDTRRKISASVTLLLIGGANAAIYCGTDLGLKTIGLGAAVGISFGMAINYVRGAIAKNSESKLEKSRREFKRLWNDLEDKNDFIGLLSLSQLRVLSDQMKSLPTKFKFDQPSTQRGERVYTQDGEEV